MNTQLIDVQQPTLAEFLAAPLIEVHKVVPATVIFGAGGTRRRAVLAGMSPESETYAAWTRQQMVACYDLIFAHGVQHLVAAMLVDSHNQETTAGYRDKLIAWTSWAIAGPQAMADYARQGWRVRLIGVESWPALADVAAQVAAATSHHQGPTLWYSVASQHELSWQRILQVAIEQQITNRQALIRAVYGEDIPLATLHLGAGKPQVEASVVPPLLVGKMECYWRQHLGYDLDVTTLRTILYDYAYLRRTWRADKTGRAEQIVDYAQAWKNPPILGLGTRLGPFWYPASIPQAATDNMTDNATQP